MISYKVDIHCDGCTRRTSATIQLNLRAEQARDNYESWLRNEPFAVVSILPPVLKSEFPVVLADDGKIYCAAKCQSRAAKRELGDPLLLSTKIAPSDNALTRAQINAVTLYGTLSPPKCSFCNDSGEQCSCNELPTDCSICGKPQFKSPAGVTCENGHGGAEGVPMKSDLELAVEPPAPAPTPSITLTAGQQAAYDLVCNTAVDKAGGKFNKITGYAGTGKSTLVREILAAIGPTILLAPTGKAAARLREVTGAPASTIHSWLYAPEEDTRTGDVKFTRKPHGLLDVTANRTLIVDEFSMVAEDIWHDLDLARTTRGVNIVAVGDGFQLPPVQERGSTFEPLKLEADGEAALTEVMRQAKDNPIIAASMDIRAGRAFDGLRKLFKMTPKTVPEAAFNNWTNGGVTIVHRNVTRMRLNFEIRTRRGYDTYLITQPGEPLLVLKNNPRLMCFNGEIVKFSRWIEEPREARHVTDKYKQKEADLHFGLAELEGGKRAVLCYEELSGWCEINYGFMARAIADKWTEEVTTTNVYGELETKLVPVPLLSANYGYVFTAHKSQGSQWPNAIVLVEPSVRLNKEDGLRWLYTAVTRASQVCGYAIGDL